MKARKDHSRACDTYRHVIRGDYEQTRKDLLAGADPNLKDGDGNTLLDLAIKTNNHSLIELLSAKH
ncbi:MAG: ankyrin repeat domain-containing protein [Leptospirales bacterium]|nr:ankyrin repeat domain-containing protein [Leptospirales bacterium]